MSTREEIEAAATRLSSFNAKTMDGPRRSDYKWGWVDRDRKMLANLYLADRQQRERDQQPPTREMFERLDRDMCASMALVWDEGAKLPVLVSVWDSDIELDTIAKLRAACLLLGIQTEGVL